MLRSVGDCQDILGDLMSATNFLLKSSTRGAQVFLEYLSTVAFLDRTSTGVWILCSRWTSKSLSPSQNHKHQNGLIDLSITFALISCTKYCRSCTSKIKPGILHTITYSRYDLASIIPVKLSSHWSCMGISAYVVGRFGLCPPVFCGQRPGDAPTDEDLSMKMLEFQ